MRTVESEKKIAEICKREPGMDPRACSGRTTRMLERVIDTVLDMRQDCIVVGLFEMQTVRYLMPKLQDLLAARGLEYNFNRAARTIEFNGQVVDFTTRMRLSAVRFRPEDATNIFFDND